MGDPARCRVDADGPLRPLFPVVGIVWRPWDSPDVHKGAVMDQQRNLRSAFARRPICLTAVTTSANSFSAIRSTVAYIGSTCHSMEAQIVEALDVRRQVFPLY